MSIEEMLEHELDRAMKYHEKRVRRLSQIAKEHPATFIAHIKTVLSRVTKEQYLEYSKEIKYLGKSLKDKDFASHGEKLKRDAGGFEIFLKLVLGDKQYHSACVEAGINDKVVYTLIRGRAEQVYPPPKEKRVQRRAARREARRAEIFKSPKDSVSNKFWKGEIPFNALTAVGTAKKDKYGAVVALTYDKEKGGAIYTHDSNGVKIELKTPKPFVQYDREVHDAIVSLWRSPDEWITSLEIYRTIARNPKAKLTENEAKDIEDSMLRFRGSMLTIITDRTGNEEAWDKTMGEKMKPERERWPDLPPIVDGIVIPFDSESSGEFPGVRDRWRVLRRPVLHRYSEIKGQVSTTKIHEIERPLVKRVKDVQVLYGEISRSIDTMKHTKAKAYSRDITWARLYKLDGSDTGSNANSISQAQSKTRNKVLKILDELLENGVIKGYTYKDKEHMKLVGKRWKYHTIGIDV